MIEELRTSTTLAAIPQEPSQERSDQGNFRGGFQHKGRFRGGFRSRERGFGFGGQSDNSFFPCFRQHNVPVERPQLQEEQ